MFNNKAGNESRETDDDLLNSFLTDFNNRLKLKFDQKMLDGIDAREESYKFIGYIGMKLLRRSLTCFFPTNICNDLSEIYHATENSTPVEKHFQNICHMRRFLSYLLTGMPVTLTEMDRHRKILCSKKKGEQFRNIYQKYKDGQEGWAKIILEDPLLLQVFNNDQNELTNYLNKISEFECSPVSYVGLILLYCILKNSFKENDPNIEESNIKDFQDNFIDLLDKIRNQFYYAIELMKPHSTLIKFLADKEIIMSPFSQNVFSFGTYSFETSGDVTNPIKATINTDEFTESKTFQNICDINLLHQAIQTEYSSKSEFFNKVHEDYNQKLANEESLHEELSNEKSPNLLLVLEEEKISSHLAGVFGKVIVCETISGGLEQYVRTNSDFIEDTEDGNHHFINYNKFTNGVTNNLIAKDSANVEIYLHFLNLFNFMFNSKDEAFLKLMKSHYINQFFNIIVSDMAEKAINLYVGEKDPNIISEEKTKMKSNFRRSVQRALLNIVNHIRYDKNDKDRKVIPSTAQESRAMFLSSYNSPHLYTESVQKLEHQFATNFCKHVNEGSLTPLNREELVDGYIENTKTNNNRTRTLKSLTLPVLPRPTREAGERAKVSVTHSALMIGSGPAKRTLKKDNRGSRVGDLEEFNVESVVDHRPKEKFTRSNLQLHVKFAGFGLSQDDWVLFADGDNYEINTICLDYVRKLNSLLIRKEYRFTSSIQEIINHSPETADSIADISFTVQYTNTAVTQVLTYKEISKNANDILSEYCHSIGKNQLKMLYNRANATIESDVEVEEEDDEEEEEEEEEEDQGDIKPSFALVQPLIKFLTKIPDAPANVSAIINLLKVFKDSKKKSKKPSREIFPLSTFENMLSIEIINDFDNLIKTDTNFNVIEDYLEKNEIYVEEQMKKFDDDYNDDDDDERIIVQSSLAALPSSVTASISNCSGILNLRTVQLLHSPISDDTNIVHVKLIYDVFYDSLCLIINNATFELEISSIVLPSDFFQVYYYYHYHYYHYYYYYLFIYLLFRII